jgi:hypothetical protein
MSKLLGKCPYCEDGKIEVRAINVDGKPVKLYACTNAHWHFENDFAELTKESTCNFRIFANQLRRWNKKAIGENEIRTLLKEQQVKVRLYSVNAKKEYFKWVILDKEYGASVLWEDEVQ